MSSFSFAHQSLIGGVNAPSHYNGPFGSGYGDEQFGCVVEKSDYLNIDTNTVKI